MVSLKKLETNWNLVLSHCSCMKLKMHWYLYLIVTYNKLETDQSWCLIIHVSQLRMYCKMGHVYFKLNLKLNS